MFSDVFMHMIDNVCELMSINFTTLATGALSFTLALAWNDAVSKTISSLYPPHTKQAAAWHTIIYAVVVTLLVIIVVIIFDNIHKKMNGGTGIGEINTSLLKTTQAKTT